MPSPIRAPHLLNRSEMRTRLKICGITALEDARYCAGAGVEYLGFVLYPASPRYIAPTDAAEIVSWVYGPQPVGVFVNPVPDEANAIAEAVGFALIQLSGEESVETCRALVRPVIKTFHVRPDTSPDILRRQMDAFLPHVSAFLLDTAKAGLFGGTGESFDWRVAAALCRDFPIFLAGGLHAGNVADAIEAARPFGIDLSSGIESAPGKKDFDKLAALFDALERVHPSS